MTLPDFTEHGYQVIQELGYNQYGGRTTYLAVDRSQQQVVIKEFCFAQRGSAWAGYEAHQREIRVLEQLNHPRIPRYLHSFETEYGFCLVQEYKDAPSLARKNDFKPEEIKKIALSVLEILADLQSRKEPVFHRDIKPENILVDRDLNAYLIDFGLARIDSGSRTITVVIAGTPGFMPHEQLYDLQLTKASDLYSLGATLICLLTKTPSSEIKQLISPQNVFYFKKIPPLHPDFVRWLKKMVAPDVNDRFPDARTALDKLKSIRIEGLSLSEKLGNSKLIKSAAIMAMIGGIVWSGIVLAKSKDKQREIAAIITLIGSVAGIGIVTAKSKHKQRKSKEKEEIQKQWDIEGQQQREIEEQKQRAIQEQQQREIEEQRREFEGQQQREIEKQLQRQREIQEQLQNPEQNAQRLVFNRKCVRCNLQNVNLRLVKLQGVDLRGANLKGADLEFAEFSGANLQRANLKGAKLDYANFDKANLEGANLEGTDFKLVKGLKTAKLKNATMPDGKKYEEWIENK